MEDDGWIVGVFWPEFDTAHVLEQAFDRVLAINDGHDDIAVLWVLGAIDDDLVVIDRRNGATDSRRNGASLKR